jgi:hypothetical protein
MSISYLESDKGQEENVEEKRIKLSEENRKKPAFAPFSSLEREGCHDAGRFEPE